MLHTTWHTFPEPNQDRSHSKGPDTHLSHRVGSARVTVHSKETAQAGLGGGAGFDSTSAPLRVTSRKVEQSELCSRKF